MTLEPLTVGVTGHRPARLGDVEDAALAARMRTLFQAIADAAGPGRGLRLVSNLAEGADSIAATVALDMGWQLDVVLPFERRRNAEDFPDERARAALETLLARATSVFELCSGCSAPEPTGAAYERAGRVMLAQSDLLLAVWDGQPAQGRGGAGQIVAEAVASGVPVLHMALGPNAPTRLLWAAPDSDDIGPHNLDTVPESGLDALPRLTAHLTHGEDSPPPAAQTKGRLTASAVYPVFLAAMGVRKLSAADFAAASPEAARAELLAGCAAARAATPFGQQLSGVLAQSFGAADASATDLSRRFRSAYIANYTLAALAVFTALIGLALPKAAKPALLVTELIIIAAILIITRLGNKSAWHKRWLDSRQVAEQLRVLAISAQLGDLRLRANGQSAARTVARRLGLPNAVADPAYLAATAADLGTLIDAQIAYLEADAHRMHQLEHRLHRLGGVLFLATATACLLYLAATLTLKANPGRFDDLAALVIWGTILTAGLPAIGSAIYGIRIQGDFSGVAERAAARARDLRRLRQLTRRAPPSYDNLARHAMIAADVLQGELNDWLRANSARPLALPG